MLTVDSIAVWRHQIPTLVAAGYRVIAPDQRGFGLTEAPRATRAYAIENYVADLAALLDTLRVEKVRLVTRGNWWLWRKMLRYDPEFAQWKAELSRPGRLTAAINIYRANLKLMLPRQPTLELWLVYRRF